MAFKYNVINQVIAKSQALGNIAFDAAEARFEEEKAAVIEQFENDEVTRELVNGAVDPLTANISKTLTGHPGKPVGNLFSFIGFNTGKDVITPVKEALIRGWNIIRTQKKITGRGGSRRITYNFTSKLDTTEIENASPLPFENGSWVRAIERGISGVTNYLAGAFGGASRSGGGIQIEHEISGKSYTKRDYLFKFINDALRRLKE